ncbi:hypothetical protein SAMN05216371_1406 [Streptomyces sp. TLI_053]|uniref:hypothetical protein n=1 Tax=Streptomyces sp. TLI_053 TaxID=1855352 RepID=UPI00087BB1EE|nr:hypothetical protein [Streptomyces sp. TLI_053]SDT15120.1 hypothetical protein SAMN05216371_1406 [Streptomyces sp. TLI_053]
MAGVANPAVWRSVREAALPQVSPEREVAVLSLLGTRAMVACRVDEVEHGRRQTACADRLDSIPMLERLLCLPVGIPVPMASLSDPAVVGGLPQGAVHRDGDMVTRLAVRPLAVDIAVVRVVGWRNGLERAGRFAPFCCRAVLVDEGPQMGEEGVLAEAAFYGIGVLVRGPEGIRTALEPEVYRPQRYTVAAWHFVEELYARLR